MRHRIILILLLAMATVGGRADVPTVTWDRHSLIMDGHRVCPVMGEVHYSRIPAAPIFFTKTAPPVNMFTNDSPDELKPKIK